jgi:hypothetical protein
MFWGSVPLVFSLLLLSSCGGFTEHKVVNVGKQTMYEVTIHCSRKTFDHGVLVPGGHSSYHGSFRLRPGPITISWRDGDGARFRGTVTLGASRTTAEAVFFLDGKDVTVTPAR